VVILVGLITLPVPINAIRGGLRELLLLAPDQQIQNKIKEIIRSKMDQKVFDQWQLYILKTGRKYWLTLTVIPVSEKIFANLTDKVRSELEPDISKELSQFNLEIFITKDLSRL